MEGAPADVEAAIEASVKAALGLSVQGLEPLAGGFGTRLFFRVHTRGKPASLVARVEAPEAPGIRPEGSAPEPALEPLRSLLEEHGLPVPARYGGDPKQGIDLLEDAGDHSFESEARTATLERRKALYTLALALVPKLQRISDPGGVPAFARRLDAKLIAYKGALFSEWSLPPALGRQASPAERDAVREAFAWIATALEDAPHRLAHRDFQSRNLHLRDDGSLALLDFQGAWLAPPEYDLVCLLRDSYVELPEAEIREHLERIAPELPDRPQPASLARRFDLLTLTRKGKDHARFLQAAARGDERGLAYLPATVRALRRAAQRCAGLDPRLARLAELVDRLPETPCAP